MVPTALFGLLVFHLLRTHVAERYVVPTPSMEPTLHGSEIDGDVVLVDKTAGWRPSSGWLRPFALVVVREWEAGLEHHIVKRLIATGPTAIALRDGDVFLRDPATGAMHRQVKSPTEQPELRQTAFVVDPTSGIEWMVDDPATWQRDDGAFVVRARSADALVATRSSASQAERWSETPPVAGLPGHFSTARSLDTSFVCSNGAVLGGGRWTRDIGTTVELTLPATGIAAVHLVIEHLDRYYTVRWGVDGALSLDEMDAPTGITAQGPPLPPGVPCSLTFGYLDGRIFALHDGRQVLWQPFELPVRANLQPRPTRQRVVLNGLHVAFAGEGDAAARVTRLRAFHDVYYEPSDEVFEIDAGQLFLLGDNSKDSRDSRSRPRDPYDLRDLIGRPLAILAPPARRRWL